MKFIEDYANAYVTNSSILGYSIRTLFNTTSIFIMPMVNPDGVNLVTNSIPINSPSYQMAKNISSNFSEISFTSRLESKYKRCGFKKLPTNLKN